jgi:hypothetical protein
MLGFTVKRSKRYASGGCVVMIAGILTASGRGRAPGGTFPRFAAALDGALNTLAEFPIHLKQPLARPRLILVALRGIADDRVMSESAIFVVVAERRPAHARPMIGIWGEAKPDRAYMARPSRAAPFQ